VGAAGLILAISVKAVGVVLLVPAALAYRFIPGSLARRRGLMATVLVPPATIYLAMCFYGYTLNGKFSPTVGGGYSLIGHVAWMLDPESLPEAYRELGRVKMKEIQALYSAIPPYTEPNAYVDYTLNRYNSGLYEILIPSFVPRIIALTPPPDSNPGTASATNLDVRTNELFGAWARAAVAARPLDYAAHSILHFWGLWRDSLRQIYRMGDARRWLLAAGFDLSRPGPHRATTAPDDYYKYIDGWRERNATTVLAKLQYNLISHYGGSRSAIQLILMSMALVLSALYLVPRNYSPRLAAAIVWALFINAYFAGHSLFQVTLVRYGEVIVPLLPLLLGLILWAIGEWAVSKWRRRKSKRLRAHPARPERVVPAA
jgi:hypothetical protein